MPLRCRFSPIQSPTQTPGSSRLERPLPFSSSRLGAEALVMSPKLPQPDAPPLAIDPPSAPPFGGLTNGSIQEGKHITCWGQS